MAHRTEYLQGQDYEGYTDIKLANGAKDPSFLRDVLGYQIVRQYMDAPLANYANLYVNGTLNGLYANTESISKKFVNSRFGSKSNAFFDCSPPEGAGPQGGDYPNLVYLGQDSSQLNQAFCSSRNSILNTSEKVGKNTALLAGWDKWAQGLSSVLTDAQMQKFMQWQSQVDLLGEFPF